MRERSGRRDNPRGRRAAVGPRGRAHDGLDEARLAEVVPAAVVVAARLLALSSAHLPRQKMFRVARGGLELLAARAAAAVLVYNIVRDGRDVARKR